MDASDWVQITFSFSCCLSFMEPHRVLIELGSHRTKVPQNAIWKAQTIGQKPQDFLINIIYIAKYSYSVFDTLPKVKTSESPIATIFFFAFLQDRVA